jgi:competence protein ComFC
MDCFGIRRSMNFEGLIKIFKDYLFPVFCLECKKEGTLLCPLCVSKIFILGVFVCPVCHSERSRGIPCDHCKKNTPLSSHIALGIYRDENTLGKLIHEWKYNFVIEALDVLEPVIFQFMQSQSQFFSSIDLIVPVPLHKKRLAFRGFNQAEELAKVVAKISQKEMIDVLFRKISTEQQAKLSKHEREKNVADAFELKKGVELQGKNILLIDDVFTTGSTLNECAKVLKRNGASEVHAFTLARG